MLLLLRILMVSATTTLVSHQLIRNLGYLSHVSRRLVAVRLVRRLISHAKYLLNGGLLLVAFVRNIFQISSHLVLK